MYNIQRQRKGGDSEDEEGEERLGEQKDKRALLVYPMKTKQINLVQAIQENIIKQITNKKSSINVCAVVIFKRIPITRGQKNPKTKTKIALKQTNKPPKQRLAINKVESKR